MRSPSKIALAAHFAPTLSLPLMPSLAMTSAAAIQAVLWAMPGGLSLTTLVETLTVALALASCSTFAVLVASLPFTLWLAVCSAVASAVALAVCSTAAGGAAGLPIFAVIVAQASPEIAYSFAH